MSDTSPAALPDPELQSLLRRARNACFILDDGDNLPRWGRRLVRDLADELEARSATPKAQRAEGWVSVLERLPEKHTEVLIALDTISLACTGQWSPSRAQPGEIEWLFPRENHWAGEPTPQVTHWMPLPDPPLAAAQPPKEAA